METLGLSSTPQKNDNILQRLFWPSIQNQEDIDLMGQRGFWICVVIGVLSGVVLTFTGHPIAGLATTFIFVAGACGVRERSILAASLMLCLYSLNVGTSVLLPPHRLPSPVPSLVIVTLLIANVRAAILSKRWLSDTNSEDNRILPDRLNSTYTDKIANQVPGVLWPRLKYVFFAASVLYIVLAVSGVWMLLAQDKVHAPEPASTRESQQLQVGSPQ